MASVELGEQEASRNDISKESGDKKSLFLPSKQENTELVDLQIVEKIRELVERKFEDDPVPPPEAEEAEAIDRIVETKNKMHMFANIGKSILDSRLC